jgi:hypothetical protein
MILSTSYFWAGFIIGFGTFIILLSLHHLLLDDYIEDKIKEILK